MDDYAAIFQTNGIDGAKLATLDKKSLMEMGVMGEPSDVRTPLGLIMSTTQISMVMKKPLAEVIEDDILHHHILEKGLRVRVLEEAKTEIFGNILSHNPVKGTVHIELDTGDDVEDVGIENVKPLRYDVGDVVEYRSEGGTEWLLGEVATRLPFNLYNIRLQGEAKPLRVELRVRPVLMRPGADRVRRELYKRKEGEESSCGQQ